jgi:PAS domain S-box-containing protein
MSEKPTYEEMEQRIQELEQAESERKRTADKLEESEARLKMLFEYAPDAYYLTDPKGNFIDGNIAAEKLIGYNRQELIGKNFLKLKLLPLKQIPKAAKNLAKNALDQPTGPDEYTLICKDGSQVAVEILTYPIKIKGQSLVLGIARDIAERKLAEEALLASEEKFRGIAERSFDSIFMSDDQGYFTYLSPAIEGIFGFKPDQMLGKHFYNFLSKFEVPRVLQLFAAAMKGEYTDILKIEVVKKDGSKGILEVGHSCILKHGQVVGLQGLIRDVTDRVQAEEKLKNAYGELERQVEKRTSELFVTNKKLKEKIKEHRQTEKAMMDSEEKYRGLFDDSIAATYVFDEKMNFLDSNQAGISLLGYSREELLNMSIPDDADPIVVVPAHEQLLGGDRIINYEHRLKRKDGKVITVLNNSRPITDTDGHVIGMQSTLIDITARKQAEEEKKKLEEQIQQAQRLEAIGTLAGGIAHDFNNLLMAIQGNTSLLLYDIDSRHPHFDALKNIEKFVRSGAKLTNQLLGYARKGKFRVKLVNFNQLVEETADTIGRTRKEIIIRRELSEDLFAIKADQGQIEQVLLNFYINAADSMPDGGKIIIKTLNVTHEDMRSKLYDPKPGNYIQLTVTDTGIGMDKRTQERIFEPFFTTKEMGRGTGLGLASVYGIVKSHGGYIEIESEKGHGTTFITFLPACNKEIQKTIKSSDRIIEGNGTILLVDDEEIVLEVGVKMLERLGYSVLKSGSGIEAVEVYKNNKEAIDLVILDMIMPEMGGGETYGKMKKINPIVKVLLSSGYSLDGKAAEILKRGCKGFIQKPFNLQKLSGKVKEILVNQ